MKRFLVLMSALALAGCAGQGPGLFNNAAPPPAGNNAANNAANPDAADPNAATPPAAGNTDTAQNNNNTNTVTVTDNTTEVATLPPAPPPPPNATTPEQFDTTTEEDRNVAVAPTPDTSGDGRLGTTVASIGDAAEPGFWIKTPLVSAQGSGRLFYPASGRTIQVQLIPSGGDSGSGSQVSLAALRLLNAPLDGLPELVVYQN
ncbi:MAG: hypothetical protein AAF748_09865 [Pseudomonadota bacterium]